MWPDDELDRIFGPVEAVDPGPLMQRRSALLRDLDTLERVHGWHDDEEGEVW
jgi:hypothetical protein